MKAAIMAHENDPAWTDHLPAALLGLRTSYKADLDTSPAKLVHGQPLTVPGEFLPDFPAQTVPVVLQQLGERVGDLLPVPHARHGVQVERVPAALGKIFTRFHLSGWTNIGSPCNSPTRVRSKLSSTGARGSRCRGEQR
jgi:hypothetical protein